MHYQSTNNTLIEREKWLRDITDLLIERLGIPNGDAQAIVDAHSFELAQEWGKESSPEVATERLTTL